MTNINENECEVRAINHELVEMSKKRLPSDENIFLLSETFTALADSNRVKILLSLKNQELCVCDVAAIAGISDSAASQHLRLLRTLQIVKRRKEGRMMYYSLSDDHIRNLLEISLEHTSH